jgi:excisionase family DNA binding protein
MSLTLKDLINRGEIIRPDELAKGLKVSLSAIYALVERGQIDHLRIGKSIRFEPETIQEFLKERRRVTS